MILTGSGVVAKGVLDGYVPTQISLGQQRPFTINIMNKKRAVHTLEVPCFHCKSTADIKISSIITSRDLGAFYLILSIM